MPMERTTKTSGGCLCGAVQYEVAGALRPVVYCHCEQCQKTSGLYVAATACHPNRLKLLVDDGLRWYRSSSTAQRGFCSNCGSSLFWRPDHERFISIMAGTLSQPTGLTAACHIYTEMVSDYYSIADGLPKYAEDYPDTLRAELE
jgi:hypothetical protein